MAHDNPAFCVTATSDLALNEMNRQRAARGLVDVPPGADTPQQINTPIKKNQEEKSKMGYCRWKWSWFINALVILSLCGLIILLETDIITFRPIGFYCKDPKISYKFNGDTVPFTYLLGITIMVPFIGISLVETVVQNHGKAYTEDKRENLRGMKQAWSWYCQFLFGLLLVILITEAGKSIIPEPRPHFLDTCKPDKAVNCTSGFVSEYKCTNVNVPRYLVKDSYRSFPSGHSSLGLYTAVFMMWFFQNRMPSSNFLIVPWLQCLFLLWGMICSLTRITDRRHHWWDVLAGATCGVIVATYTVKISCRNFLNRHSWTMKADKCINGGSGNSKRDQSSRRLLSSTSSCGTPPDDKELRAVQST